MIMTVLMLVASQGLAHAGSVETGHTWEDGSARCVYSKSQITSDRWVSFEADGLTKGWTPYGYVACSVPWGRNRTYFRATNNVFKLSGGQYYACFLDDWGYSTYNGDSDAYEAEALANAPCGSGFYENWGMGQTWWNNGYEGGILISGPVWWN